ncbi:MAG: hypothetical protein P8X82_11300 [Gemmatimonadales bacterium]|jgi:hypothetical protein
MSVRPSLIIGAALAAFSCGDRQLEFVAEFATSMDSGESNLVPCGMVGATVTWFEKVDEDLLPSASSGEGR